MSSYEFLAITKFMDDFRQNSPPWRDDDDDGACSIGLLVAHALQFTVFSSLDMSAYVMQCSALCPLECGLLLVYVYILEFGKLVFFFHYFSTTYCILLYIVQCTLDLVTHLVCQKTVTKLRGVTK